ncbi:MAG: acetyl-CoA carboxylase, biotin carboxyl carrier protein, partial [Mangrovicoccus sp.]
MTDRPHDADVAFIEALAKLLRDNDLTELQVKRDYNEDDSLDVRISRAAPQAVAAPAMVAAPAPVAAASPVAAPAAPAT